MVFISRTSCIHIVYILLSCLWNGQCSSTIMHSASPSTPLYQKKAFPIQLENHHEQARFCIVADDEQHFTMTHFGSCLQTDTKYGNQTLQRLKIHRTRTRLLRGPQLVEEMSHNDCALIRSDPTICWLEPPVPAQDLWLRPSLNQIDNVLGYCDKVSQWISMTDGQWEAFEERKHFSRYLLDEKFLRALRKECSRWFDAGPDIVNKVVSGYIRNSSDVTDIHVPLHLYGEFEKFISPDLMYLIERDPDADNECTIL
eukprot:964022_1